MSDLRASVLIASTRPKDLIRCLDSLSVQSVAPHEVLVVWQGDDIATREAAAATALHPGLRLKLVHCCERGVVPAENAALDQANGEIILLIDDDATAPRDWVAKHLSHYSDPSIGAVGGPFTNFDLNGIPFPTRVAEPIGDITWFGRIHGNAFDHDASWRQRPPIEVQHLAGGNMSLRRAAFDRFETGLRPYWQMFEMDACLQVRARGYRVLFDFDNGVDHFPTNSAFRAGRDGDLEIKMFNPAYNQAFVLAKHMSGWRRPCCFGYMLGVGSVAAPGLIGFLIAARRYGNLRRELHILRKTILARLNGWRDGSRRRQRERRPHSGRALTAGYSNT